MLISASLRIGLTKTGIKSIQAVPFQIETLDGMTDCVNHDLRRER